jgi:hypothetical protein
MWQQLFRTRKASVLIVVAMSSLAIIAMAAFSINLGSAYSALSQDQRLADAAAYSGALAYNTSGTTTAATNAVSRIATLNGLSSTSITAALTTSPSGDGNNAIKAQVTSSNPIYFASALGASNSVSIGGTSIAEISAAQGGIAGCVTAIQPSGTGISLTGGTSITASGCAVASNGTVSGSTTSISTTCGTTITTGTVDYASSAAPPISALGCTFIKPPSGTPSVTETHVTSTDKLATNPEVTAATAQLTTAEALTAPSAPTVSGGTAISLGFSATPAPAMPNGCTASFGNSAWTISCPAAGTYTFGTITLGGGLTLNLNWNAATANRTFVFNGNINGTNGSAINLGAGNYTISGGILASGSLAVTWQGGGTFNVGTTSASPCPAVGGYSICTSGSGRVIIPGPSNFTLAGGIFQGASGMPSTPALTLGAGSTANSYSIGKGADGYSINNANGSTILGDSTTSTTTTCNSTTAFCAAGNILSSGGTCIALPANSQHYIDGYLNASGGVALGSGTYTIAGYAAFGAGSGGNVGNCPTSGTTTGVGGLGVTLVLGGTSSVTCSGISNTAFCLGAGYSSVNLVAPTSSATVGSNTAGLAVVGPTSSGVTAGAVFSSGATNTRISGVFYFPNGPITINGGAALQDTVDTNACLEVIGASITLSGGGVAGTTCPGSNNTTLIGSQGSSSGGTIAIVQ